MRIFLAQHREADYLGGTVTVGLYEGSHEIYESPYAFQYHGKNDEGYPLSDGKLGFSSPPGFMANPIPENYHSEEEVLDLAPTFDLFVMHSVRTMAIEAIRKISYRLGRVPDNLVICDGEDHSFINEDLIRSLRPLVYFKRELVKGQSPIGWVPHLQTWILPLQFGAFTRSFRVDLEEKEYDLFLSLGYTHESRMVLLVRCLEYALNRNLRHWIGTNHNAPILSHPHGDQFRGILDWATYMKKQSRSRVGVSIRGYGRDALHAWEAFMSGAAVLYCDPGLYIPYPFKPYAHYVPFREDSSDINDALDLFLLPENEPYRASTAEAGKEHCLTYHTTKARADYILKIADDIANGRGVRLEGFGL